MVTEIKGDIPVRVTAERYGDKIKITMVDRRHNTVFDSMFLLEYLNSLPDMGEWASKGANGDG